MAGEQQAARQGDATWRALSFWTQAQKASERLAAKVVASEGYESVDPSQPLGGRDGKRDVLAVCGGNRWIVAVYFRKKPGKFAAVKKKFLSDLAGVKANAAVGIAFVTNQEISEGDRKKLGALAGDAKVDLFHLERLVHLLDTPRLYGIRQEYLGIEMSREEFLSFIAVRDAEYLETTRKLGSIVDQLRSTKHHVGLRGQLAQELESIHQSLVGNPIYIPLQELRQFKRELSDPFAFGLVPGALVPYIPLEELRQFKRELSDPFAFGLVPGTLVPHIPLEELRQFKRELNDPFAFGVAQGALVPHIPLEDLRSFKEELASFSHSEAQRYLELLDQLSSRVEELLQKCKALRSAGQKVDKG